MDILTLLVAHLIKMINSKLDLASSKMVFLELRNRAIVLKHNQLSFRYIVQLLKVDVDLSMKSLSLKKHQPNQLSFFPVT